MAGAEDKWPEFWIRCAAVVMALGIVFGAFGAHALQTALSDPMKAVFETGVRYQLIHGLGLWVVAWLASRTSSVAVTASGILFLCGVVLFSGSLYLLALTGKSGWGWITPLGGAAFIAGWLCLAFH